MTPTASQAVTHLGDVDSWASFNNAIRGPLAIQKSLSGAGIRILTPTISSPTFKDQMQSFLAMYPQAKWHVYEPINRDNVLEGAKLAFGQPVETRYDFSKADVIVSLDADFLYAGFPGNTRYIRDFASRRNPDVRNEPALRDREHAKFDGSEGGSSAAGQGLGDRRPRPEQIDAMQASPACTGKQMRGLPKTVFVSCAR